MLKVILAFALLIIVTIAFAFYQRLTTPVAKIKNHEFQLLIAKTEDQRQTGLSKYTQIDKDKAMIFIFEKSDYYRFWMKDMKFPIDIIFIKDGKISKIYKDVPVLKAPIDNLPIYSPPVPIDKVLEVNAGISQKYDFKPGDIVELRNVK